MIEGQTVSSEASPPSLEDVYFHASEIQDRNAREAYLAEVYAGDDAARLNMEELLDARAARGGFLDCEAQLSWASRGLPDRETVGRQIGNYMLLEEIGEGGMGVVYMAEQTAPVRRRVALKIIKPGMDTRQVIARFEMERQALALMDHPNIARVLDAGATDFGRPYFVMELVRGITITEYCDRECLSVDERLGLFAQVCRAVHHAHQKGVIHRDLKPSNILVTVIDGVPAPKVIDFGVVKATGAALSQETLVTGFHQFVGTPLYMSPEQADVSGVDVDSRSDIFSLGILLYELLTGTTPLEEGVFRETPFEEIRRVVREVDPPRPSNRLSTMSDDLKSTVADKRRATVKRLAISVRGELDWIVMKALDKNRSRRYESADALAVDIDRFLLNEPVAACPPSRRYWLAKFARRHRIALAASISVATAIVAGLGVSIWQATRATLAEHAKDDALQQARRAVDDMYTDVAEKWLAEQGSMSAIQREFLEKASNFYAVLAEDSQRDPEIRYQNLRALNRVARIQVRLGRSSQAVDAYLRAIAESKQSIREFPREPRFHVEQLRAMVDLSRLYRGMDRHKDAEDQVEIASSFLTTPLPGDLLPEDRGRFAAALTDLSADMIHFRRTEKADLALQMAKSIWEPLLDEFPETFAYRYGAVRTQSILGSRQMWLGTTDEANLRKSVVTLRDAESRLLALMQERPEDVSVRRVLSSTLTNLANALTWTNQEAAALEICKRNLPIAKELAEEFPADADRQEGYLISLMNLAGSRSRQTVGSPSEVLGYVLDAHKHSRALLDRNPEVVLYKTAYLQTLIASTHALYEHGDRDQARQLQLDAEEGVRLSQTSNSSFQIAGLLFESQLTTVAVMVDFGEYKKAAETLISGPWLMHNFGEGGLTLPEDGNALGCMTFIGDREFKANMLLIPALLVEECIRLAKLDEALSTETREKFIAECTADAAHRRTQFELAADQWAAGHLAKSQDRAILIAVEGDALANAFAKEFKRATMPLCLSSATCEYKRQLFRKLMQASEAALINDPHQHLLSQVISMAPEPCRDTALALRLGRRAAELTPKDSAAALASALYRNGAYRECLDFCENIATSSERDWAAYVKTLALLKVDRHDEARATFVVAGEHLVKYLKLCEERKLRNVISVPSAETVERMKEEVDAAMNLAFDESGKQ